MDAILVEPDATSGSVSPDSARRAERRALRLSIAGALVMALLGFGFGVVTDSGAILLDGIYSSIALLLDLVTLRVALLVSQPEDEAFPFGYAHLEPQLNLIKGIIFLAVCAFAGVTAVQSINAGGRTVDLDWAVLYAVISTAGCFAVAIYMRRLSKRTNSDLVAVSSQGWLLDGMISTAVLCAFVGSWLLRDGPLAAWLPYLDPALVLVMVLLVLPVPVRILRHNLREVLLMAPPRAVQVQVCNQLRNALAGWHLDGARLRLLKVGRVLYVNLHLQVTTGGQLLTVADIDKLRGRIATGLDSLDGGLKLDLDVVVSAVPPLGGGGFSCQPTG